MALKWQQWGWNDLYLMSKIAEWPHWYHDLILILEFRVFWYQWRVQRHKTDIHVSQWRVQRRKTDINASQWKVQRHETDINAS